MNIDNVVGTHRKLLFLLFAVHATYDYLKPLNNVLVCKFILHKRLTEVELTA